MRTLTRALVTGLLVASTGGAAKTTGTTHAILLDCSDTKACWGDLDLPTLKTYAAAPAAGGRFTARDLALDETFCGQTSPDKYLWKEAAGIEGGKAASVETLRRVATGEILTGSDIDPTTHEFVEMGPTKPGERHIARCDVHVVGGVAGPPSNCGLIAVFVGKQTWLRVQPPHHGGCQHAGHFRPSGAIDIEWSLRPARDLTGISASIAQALTDRLKLSVEQDPEHDENGKVVAVRISGTAGLRSSVVLNPIWREAVDFDVSVEEVDSNTISVTGSAHIDVCQQAVGDLFQYHGMNDAQRTAYAATLNDIVRRAIEGKCRTYRELDAKTIACG
jgi:hypothetical protein